MGKLNILLFFIILIFANPSCSSSNIMLLQEHLRNKFEYTNTVQQIKNKNRQIANFYKRRNFKPQWITQEGPLVAIKCILETLKCAEKEGLEPLDYIQKIRTTEELLMQPYDLNSLLKIEIMVTELAMDYIDDLYGERLNPKNISPLFYINPTNIDASIILENGLQDDPSGKWFKLITLVHPEYLALKKILAYYRELQQNGNWSYITSPLSYKNFQNDRLVVSQIQQKLFQYGIYNSTVNGIFDRETEESLRLFQEYFGQEPDGILGPDTLKALNISVEERIKQIIVSMERWRWLTQQKADKYIIVNIAGFLLHCYRGGKEVLQLPIITGQKLRKTPIFSSTIFEIRFNPTWHVPRSIAIKDKLPLLQKDPALLLKKGYMVKDKSGNVLSPVDINWNEVSKDNFNYVLTQAPGAANALGRIFFNILSPFDIFIHDTPDTHLFKKAKRNLSSGCIRVSNPIELALFILDNHEETGLDFIHEQIESNKTSSIQLKKPVPVHLMYFTAWVDKEDKIHFSDDTYGSDDQIWHALKQRTLGMQNK